MGIDFSPMKNDLTHKKKCRCRWVALTQNDLNCILGKVVATMTFPSFLLNMLTSLSMCSKMVST